MEYAYATCILNETGEEINERNLVAVLEAAGCDVQESRVKAIVAALEDVEIDDVTGVDADAIGADRSEATGGDSETSPESQLTAFEEDPPESTAPDAEPAMEGADQPTADVDPADGAVDDVADPNDADGLWETADVEQSETATTDEV